MDALTRDGARPVLAAETSARPREAALRAPGRDLNVVFALLRRRLWLATGIAAAVMLAVVAYLVAQTPRYSATARLMIDPRQEKIVDAQQVLAGLPGDTGAIDTQVEVLRSRALLDRLVDRLGPDRDAEVRPTDARAALPSHDSASERQAVGDAIQRRLRIGRVGLTSVIDVTMTSRSAERAAEIANGLTALYLGDQLDTKSEATRHANDWLSERLAGLRGQVETAEAEVQRYKIANGLLSADGATLTEQTISGLNTQVAEARAAQAEAEARLSTAAQQLARGSTGEDVGEALNSQVVQKLREQRAEVSRTVADLQGRYGPRHPEMLKAQRQIADIDGQIQAEVQRVLSNLRAQAQVAKQRTASLQGSLAASRGTLAANGSAMVRLNELNRNADSARTLYQSYLDRFKQTTAQQGIAQTDARILSAARAPSRPTSPNAPVILGLGAALALAAALAGVLVAEGMESRLSTAADVERTLGLPCLGAVPTLASTLTGPPRPGRSPVEAVVARPLSRFAESFRSLRTSVLFSRAGEPVHVVALTSALPGEGKTTTCVALARTSALCGVRTVVVDCDLRRRALNALVTPEPKAGLIDVLTGRASLDDALVRDAPSGACFLPLFQTAQTPEDILGSPAMDRLLADLRARFDLVVLDTAPVLAVADTRALAAKTDAVVFLARWRKTPRLAVENGLKALEAVGAYIAGVALTQVDAREQTRTGYGDPGYYAERYAAYYDN